VRFSSYKLVNFIFSYEVLIIFLTALASKCANECDRVAKSLKPFKFLFDFEARQGNWEIVIERLLL